MHSHEEESRAELSAVVAKYLQRLLKLKEVLKDPSIDPELLLSLEENSDTEPGNEFAVIKLLITDTYWTEEMREVKGSLHQIEDLEQTIVAAGLDGVMADILRTFVEGNLLLVLSREMITQRVATETSGYKSSTLKSDKLASLIMRVQNSRSALLTIEASRRPWGKHNHTVSVYYLTYRSGKNHNGHTANSLK